MAAMLLSDGTLALCGPVGPSGAMRLCMTQVPGLAVRPVLALTAPCRAEILRADGTTYGLHAGYSDVGTPQERGQGRPAVEARAVLTAPSGTQLAFDDRYWATGAGAIVVTRRVTVEAAGAGDVAFLSEFGAVLSEPADLRDLLWFAPGMWYLDNRYSYAGTIGSDWSLDQHFFREDCCALPLVMAFHPARSTWCSIARQDLDGATVAADRTWEPLVDARLRFGAFGARRARTGQSGDPVAEVGYRYPGAAGEVPGPHGRSEGWVDRKHPLQPGFTHTYSLWLRVGQAPDYAAAVRETWRWHVGQVDPRVVPVDLGAVEQAGLGLLADYYHDYGSVPGFAGDVAGFPYLIDIHSGTVTEPNLVIGFAGRSTECAFLALRAGYARADERLKEMGRKTIDFWVRNGGRGLPHTQLSTLDWAWRDDMGADYYRLKVFLRPVVEGALAVLLAYRLEQSGYQQAAWLDWVLDCGEWLLAHQNEDGSFFRQYYWSDGTPSFVDKGNSYLPIPLLIEVGQETGDPRFLHAALRAGTFCWQAYHEANHFIGGTIDHPNIYDKEAALLSLESYLALFGATGEARWLAAAERAALFAESYVVLWNIPMPPDDPLCTWPAGHDTTGLNIISAGSGGADLYASFNAYEFARLYQLTGDAHYLRMAQLLHYSDKQIVQLHGEHGYAHDGLHQEHWRISPALDTTWLLLNPRSWITHTGPLGRGRAAYTHMYMWTIVAHLYGISKVADAFGTTDLYRVPALSGPPLPDPAGGVGAVTRRKTM